MAFLEHDLRGSVSERASHGGQDFTLRVEHLGDTEISKDEGGVCIACEVEEVLWLKICSGVSYWVCVGDSGHTSVNNIVLV